MSNSAVDSRPEAGQPSADNRVQLGNRLRRARAEAGMSLREMARRTDVSPSFISQVELGRATPSVGTLYAIVSELGLSLDSLMKEEEDHANEETATEGPGEPIAKAQAATVPHTASNPADGPVVPLPETGSLPGLQRANERPELWMGKVRWERLTPADDPAVEFLRVTYPPGTESCRPDNLMHHRGKEYIHILSGRLEVQVAFARQVMDAGDSLNFDSSTPHRLSNPYQEACVALWVVVGRQG
jgi:transcriptional regulator with XRE-family HTH domain